MARHGAYRTPGELTLRSSPGTGGLWLTNYLTRAGGSDGAPVTISADASHDGTPIDGRATIRRADWDSLWDPSRERAIATRRDGSTVIWNISWRKDSEFSTPYIQARYDKAGPSAYIVQCYITDLGITDGSFQELRWQMDSSGITLSGPAGVATPFATFGSPGTIQSSATATIRLLGDGTTNTGFDGDMNAFTLRIGGTLVADLNLAGMTDATDVSWTNSYGDTVTRSSGTSPGATGGIISPLTELRPWRRRLPPT